MDKSGAISASVSDTADVGSAGEPQVEETDGDGKKLTLEERQQKLEQLRAKMVHQFYPPAASSLIHFEEELSS
jgi:hypothetical protein